MQIAILEKDIRDVENVHTLEKSHFWQTKRLPSFVRGRAQILRRDQVIMELSIRVVPFAIIVSQSFYIHVITIMDIVVTPMRVVFGMSCLWQSHASPSHIEDVSKTVIRM
jgi:hypothetical protein